MRIAKVDGLEPWCYEDIKGIVAPEVSGPLGSRPLAIKSFGSRFICLRDGPKAGFLSLSEFASLPLNCLRVTNVLLAEFEKFVRIIQFPGTFSGF